MATTPAQRFAVADLAKRASLKGNAAIANLFRMVTMVESFPQNYTAEAVELAEGILANVLEGNSQFLADVEKFHALIVTRAYQR